MNEVAIVSVCVFAAVVLMVWGITSAITGDRDEKKVRDRLGHDYANAPAKPSASLLERVSSSAAKVFQPKSREKQSSLRKQMGYAGIYDPAALRTFHGSKLMLLLGGLIGGYAIGGMFDNSLLGVAIGGLLGYVGPTIWLKRKIKQNRKQLELGLADALDLMVVCVEAGLTVDSAMQRVGTELALAHPPISRELGITHMETRVGLSRAEALRNMGQRTGSTALQSLSAMLIQAERFGTSVAQALRIHAETLRINRQHAAEELGAKASVKMSFPLVLFIFPATFIVLAGPTVIGMMNSALFN